jgi:hypothetical protein
MVDLEKLEREWINRVPKDPVYWDWAPYSLTEFNKLLGVALAGKTDDPRLFLEVGCGIGTKCLRAVEKGLVAHGIERVAEYADEAKRLGVAVRQCDVYDFNLYFAYDILYINHPLRDGDAEVELEKYIWNEMSPGACLISVNHCWNPGPAAKAILFEEQWRGIYVK